MFINRKTSGTGEVYYFCLFKLTSIPSKVLIIIIFTSLLIYINPAMVGEKKQEQQITPLANGTLETLLNNSAVNIIPNRPIAANIIPKEPIDGNNHLSVS